MEPSMREISCDDAMCTKAPSEISNCTLNSPLNLIPKYIKYIQGEFQIKLTPLGQSNRTLY